MPSAISRGAEGFFAGLLLGTLLLAGDVRAASLPEPLTLKAALDLALRSEHPEILKAEALLAKADAERERVGTENDPELGLTAGLRVLEPSRVAFDQDRNDSYLRLDLSKRLYDAGRAELGARAAESGIRSGRQRLVGARQNRYLAVMQRFFDVMLADLRNARDTEAMAVAYVAFDKAKNRAELKQVGDHDLMAIEQDYELSRQRLAISANAQRATRAALAVALNRPEQLSSELRHGPLKALSRPLPELEPLTRQALADNPMLSALRHEVQRERERVKRVAADDKPQVVASVGAAGYAREMGSYNPLAAELTLEIPLFNGDRTRARMAEARSEELMKSAELKAAELEVRQRLTQLWLELQDLKARRQALKTSADYREMALDRSRALYEMEVSTNLGDSMVKISQQRLDEAEVTYRGEQVWAEIDALTGRLLHNGGSGEER